MTEQKDISSASYNLAQVLSDELAEIKAQCDHRRVTHDLNFDDRPTKSRPDMLAVAFSGGGIRSSCVGLGVLQRLAKAGILNQVHYISAISGGGYLLGWVTAWTKRCGSLRTVEDQLGQNTSSGKEPFDSPSPASNRFVEPIPLHYLRKYSSYLAPRVGLVSGDTLGMISVYLRNLFLNQLLLASCLVCLTLILQLVSPVILWKRAFPVRALHCCCALFLVVFAVGVLSAARALKCIGQDQHPREKHRNSVFAVGCGGLGCIILWLILPTWYADYPLGVHTAAAVLTLAIIGLTASLIELKDDDGSRRGPALRPVTKSHGFVWLIVAWAVFGAASAVVDLGFRHWLISYPLNGRQVIVGAFYTILGLPALLLALTLQSYLFIGVLGTSLADGKREWLARAAGYFLLCAAAISLLLAVTLLGPVTIHLLFSGFNQASWRKYLATAVLPGGWLFIVLTGLLGANSSKTNGDESKPSKLDFIIAVAPPVFLVGVLLLISWGTHALVREIVPLGQTHSVLSGEYLSWGKWTPSPSTQPVIQMKWPENEPLHATATEAFPSIFARSHTDQSSKWRWVSEQAFPWLVYAVLFACFFSIAAVLARRLNVNEFSLHLFYRNRLVRAFLGASQDPPSVRRPSPFTGFAMQDDIKLASLTIEQSTFEGPYPIWGATLNLTAGQDLAWQQRKGASFIYSPLYCGWDYVDPKKIPTTHEPENPDFDADEELISAGKANEYQANTGKSSKKVRAEQQKIDVDEQSSMRIRAGYSEFGFRPTGCKKRAFESPDPVSHLKGLVNGPYGGGAQPYIGTAMAASGAAVSPNSGYHTRPGVAALLAIFNLRLGWWTGNPRNRRTWKEYAPSITYLLAELMGHANDTGKYVYLSDGGHFENLGLYELVRRKVRFIICSDADGDPTFTFEDLGNSIDKCRRDFGVEIHLRAQRDIAAEGGKGFRNGHYAIGEILYPGQADPGYLLYLKSSLTNDEPSDVLGMKAQDAAFPHDSTANQFFNESMFESYRALGQHMFDVLLNHFHIADKDPDIVRKLFYAIRKQANAQKIADALPKPPPTTVAVQGAVTIELSS